MSKADYQNKVLPNNSFF